jgi:hypothetical protein
VTESGAENSRISRNKRENQRQNVDDSEKLFSDGAQKPTRTTASTLGCKTKNSQMEENQVAQPGKSCALNKPKGGNSLQRETWAGRKV